MFLLFGPCAACANVSGGLNLIHASDAAVEPLHRRVLQVDYAVGQLPGGLHCCKLPKLNPYSQRLVVIRRGGHVLLQFKHFLKDLHDVVFQLAGLILLVLTIFEIIKQNWP